VRVRSHTTWVIALLLASTVPPARGSAALGLAACRLFLPPSPLLHPPVGFMFVPPQKSTLARALMARLSERGFACRLFALDRYYKAPEAIPVTDVLAPDGTVIARLNFDCPEAVDFDAMRRDVEQWQVEAAASAGSDRSMQQHAAVLEGFLLFDHAQLASMCTVRAHVCACRQCLWKRRQGRRYGRNHDDADGADQSCAGSSPEHAIAADPPSIASDNDGHFSEGNWLCGLLRLLVGPSAPLPVPTPPVPAPDSPLYWNAIVLPALTAHEDRINRECCTSHVVPAASPHDGFHRGPLTAGALSVDGVFLTDLECHTNEMVRQSQVALLEAVWACCAKHIS